MLGDPAEGSRVTTRITVSFASAVSIHIDSIYSKRPKSTEKARDAKRKTKLKYYMLYSTSYISLSRPLKPTSLPIIQPRSTKQFIFGESVYVQVSE